MTWALVIATYNRRNILLEALAHAAKQTRPPEKIVVVDSSPDAAETRALVLRDFAPVYPRIGWKYLLSEYRSSAIQLTRGDALF